MNHLTPEEVSLCSDSSCQSFLHEQKDRFERIEDDPIPLQKGSLMYCDTIPAALILINDLRRNGHMAHLLWDLDTEEHVVHTDLALMGAGLDSGIRIG